VNSSWPKSVAVIEGTAELDVGVVDRSILPQRTGAALSGPGCIRR